METTTRVICTSSWNSRKRLKIELKKSIEILFFLHHFFLLTGIDFCQCSRKTILLISVTPNSGTWCEALSKFTNTRLKPNNNLSITYKTFLSIHGELLVFFSIFFIVSQNMSHIEICFYCYNSSCSQMCVGSRIFL